MGATNIPLSPDKAWQVAKNWFLKHDYGQPEFARMEIRPFALSDSPHKSWRRRFFYRIECIPMQFDSMLVIVLLDGTVLEPKRIPWQPGEIK